MKLQSLTITVNGQELEQAISRLMWVADSYNDYYEDFYNNCVKFTFHADNIDYPLSIRAVTPTICMEAFLAYETKHEDLVSLFFPDKTRKTLSFVVSKANTLIKCASSLQTELSFEFNKEYPRLTFTGRDGVSKQRNLLLPIWAFPKFDFRCSPEPLHTDEWTGYLKDPLFKRQLERYFDDELGYAQNIDISWKLGSNINTLFTNGDTHSRVVVQDYNHYFKVSVHSIDMPYAEYYSRSKAVQATVQEKLVSKLYVRKDPNFSNTPLLEDSAT